MDVRLVLAIFIAILIPPKLSAREVGIQELTDLIVELPNGKLRGRENERFYSYESIPYALPPVGALRFESPRLFTNKWSEVFDATKQPELCMQWDQFKPGDNKLVGVEDCLTVSIYTPKGRRNETLPVLVLIHGGAFMFGAVTDNNHEHFFEQGTGGQVIVAKLTYRLGPLGFLTTEDNVIPGNFGLKDQRLALKWIKEHIVHFGGDSARITVIGFSAGGSSVHLQLLQPYFGSVAKSAASFSGTALNPWVVLRNGRARAFELGKKLDCPKLDDSEALKQCLQRKPASTIVRAVRDFLIFGYNPFTTFGPTIEPASVTDAFLTHSPEDLIRKGNFTQIPWLVSYAAEEGGYNAGALLQQTETGAALIEVLNQRWQELAPDMLFFRAAVPAQELMEYTIALKQRYLGNKLFSAENYFELQRMYTDVLFKNGVEQAVHLHAVHGSSPVYAYTYDNPADVGIGTRLSNRTDVKFGTNHGDDFFLIFHNPARNAQLRPDEQEISKKLVHMLEDFGKDNSVLYYASCRFMANPAEGGFELMFITREGCQNKHIDKFP